MIKSYRQFEHASDYAFGCPVGSWLGVLEHKAWGKSANLILYFVDSGTGTRWQFSVYANTGYAARDGGINFKNEGPVGAMYRLTTSVTKSGYPNLDAVAA